MLFHDRAAAGRKLAPLLSEYRALPQAIVLGLPRGGVVVAAVVAESLQLPLDIIVPRKIGVPHNPEFAIGAITEDGESVFDWPMIRGLGISEDYLRGAVAEEEQEARRRLAKYRGARPPLELQGKTAILVDDGLATGATMEVAVRSVRKRGAQKIIVAVPIASREAKRRIQKIADEVIAFATPADFSAVGQFYSEFAQTEDAEVVELLL